MIEMHRPLDLNDRVAYLRRKPAQFLLRGLKITYNEYAPEASQEGIITCRCRLFVVMY